MRKMLAACGLVALALAGCSKTDTPSSTGGATTTAAAAVTKASIIEKGDQLCTDTKTKSKALAQPKTKADVGPFLKQVIELQKDELTKLKALGTPSEDADKFKDALDKDQKAIDVVESKESAIAADPNVMSSDPDIKKAGDEADAAAKAFGFKVCGASSSDSSDSTTTTAG